MSGLLAISNTLDRYKGRRIYIYIYIYIYLYGETIFIHHHHLRSIFQFFFWNLYRSGVLCCLMRYLWRRMGSYMDMYTERPS